MGNHFWSGRKIRLRAVEAKDAGIYFKYDSDYDDEADRCCDEIHFPSSYDRMVKRVETMHAGEPSNDEYMWIIENSEHIAVGNINTFDCKLRSGTFKYGLGIDRQYWGRGYAKEAIEIVLRYYFSELRYQKVTVYVYSFNERSIRLHEKMGFQQEGRIRRAVYTNGQFFDEVLYGMTKEEFDRQYNPTDKLSTADAEMQGGKL
jgi:Acetyltransferases, including N-acetylases of ribosomal proteins